MDFGLDQMQRTEGGSGARELAVRRGDHHVTEWTHGPGEYVQTDRIDSVVVGHEDAHAPIVADRDPRLGIARVNYRLLAGEPSRSAFEERGHTFAVIVALKTRGHRLGVPNHVLTHRRREALVGQLLDQAMRMR